MTQEAGPREADLLRPLGTWEGFCHLMHETFHGSSVLVFAAPLDGRLDPGRLHAALEVLVARHPLLRARIVDGPAFAAAPPEVPLSVEEAGDWRPVFDRQVNRAFRVAEEPPWRATLVRGSGDDALILALHHAIADGLSGVRLLDQLGALLRADALPPPQSLPVTPAIDRVQRDPVGRLRYLWRFLVQRWRHRAAARHRMSFEGTAPFAERRTRHAQATVEPELLDALLQASRTHDTTLHGTLAAAQLLAQHAVQGGEPAWLSFFSAVDLRPHAEPPLPDEAIGCLISVMDTLHRVDDDTALWPLARACREQLVEVSERLARVPAGVGTALPRIALRLGFGESERSGRFVNSASLTNLGRLDLDPDLGEARLRAVWFSTCRRIGDFPILVHAATLRDTLHLCLAYEEPLLSTATAHRFRDLVLDHLRAAVQ